MQREGPIIGILVEIRGGSHKPFGPQTMFIRQLLQAGDELGQICFAFTGHDVDWGKQRIRGYRWFKGAWTRRYFPLPQVVYPRDFGISPAKELVRQRLVQRGCIFSNPFIIGKWRSWEILSAYPELRGFIPETRRMEGIASLRAMLNDHPSIYLKPVEGSQGRNIMRLTRHKDGSYELGYHQAHRPARFTGGSIAGLYPQVKRLMGPRRYIMQKEIELPRFKQGIVDVRVLVQKDYEAVWKITGKACRVGGRNSITSNISGGGQGYPVSQVLPTLLPDWSKRNILLELDKLALIMAQSLERHIDTVGEMGIDLGVDIKGKLWFIEANLRPARFVFVQMGDMDTRMLAVRRPMEFAHYLSGHKLPERGAGI